VQLFYFQLLLLQKQAGLTNANLLVSQFQEGLKADIQKGINLLPSSMPLAELLEHTVKVESRLQLTPTQVSLMASDTDSKDAGSVQRDTSDGHKDNTSVAELCNSIQNLQPHQM
jgi:hypothetical protein